MVNLRRRVCVTEGCEITGNHGGRCTKHRSELPSSTPTNLREVGGGKGGRLTKVSEMATPACVGTSASSVFLESAVASYFADRRTGAGSTAAAKHVPGFEEAAPDRTGGEPVVQPQTQAPVRSTVAAASGGPEEAVGGRESGGVRAGAETDECEAASTMETADTEVGVWQC